MPLALDPNQTFEIVLDCDQGRTPTPAFVFRFLSCRDFVALDACRRSGVEAVIGDDQPRQATARELARHLVDWRGMGDAKYPAAGTIDEKAAALLGLVNHLELYELAHDLCLGSQLGPDSLKKSSPPSGTSSECSATGNVPLAPEAPPAA